MGLIRGGLVVVLSVLIFVVFLVGNTLWTLDKSLEYETIKPELVSVVKDIIGEQVNVDEVIDEDFKKVEDYCLNNSEYVFSHEESGQVFELPCSVVKEGPDATIDYAIGEFTEEMYFGEGEEARFDFKKLNESIHFYFYVSLFTAIILFVLIFLLSEAKSNAFIITGALLAISALPFAKIESFFSLIPFEFIEYFGVFFSEATTVFLISLITGLVILGFGVSIKFFGVGFKLFDFFNKIKQKQKSGKGKIVSKNK